MLIPINKRKSLDVFETDRWVAMMRAKTILLNQHQLYLSLSTISRVSLKQDFSLNRSKVVLKTRMIKTLLDIDKSMDCVFCSLRFISVWKLVGLNWNERCWNFSSWMKQDSVDQHIERKVGLEREHQPVQLALSSDPKMHQPWHSYESVFTFLWNPSIGLQPISDFCDFLLRSFYTFTRKED